VFLVTELLMLSNCQATGCQVTFGCWGGGVKLLKLFLKYLPHNGCILYSMFSFQKHEQDNYMTHVQNYISVTS